MSDDKTIIRQLKIKTGVVKRLTKENGLYKKEIETLQKSADSLEAQGAEGADVRNAQNLVKETVRVLDDTLTRLKDAVGDLQDYVVSVESKENIAKDESLAAAKTALEEAGLVVGSEA
ncbi:tubulin binding cofactor A [Pyrrhoderma noxium]|uniref:Tubulin-specific chaperone A n=1 Tax=Pyrrhoderma noxium TaxID=2282107 RepID=A0A286UR89_9AGAM|nr:tubulin binding cofactor A [Pyrrhoderma noxium]